MKLDKIEQEVIAIVIQYLLDKCQEGDEEAKAIVEKYILLGVFQNPTELCVFLAKHWKADAEVNELQRHLIPLDQYYERRFILYNIRMFIFKLDGTSKVFKKLVYPKY